MRVFRAWKSSRVTRCAEMQIKFSHHRGKCYLLTLNLAQCFLVFYGPVWRGRTKVFNFETLMKEFSGMGGFLGARLDGKTDKIFTPLTERVISWYEIWCDVFWFLWKETWKGKGVFNFETFAIWSSQAPWAYATKSSLKCPAAQQFVVGCCRCRHKRRGYNRFHNPWGWECRFLKPW